MAPKPHRLSTIFLAIVVLLRVGAAAGADRPTAEQLSQELQQQLAAVNAQHILAIAPLQNERTRAQADYQKALTDCGAGNTACKNERTEEMLRRLREIDKRQVDAEAQRDVLRLRIVAANQLAGLSDPGGDPACVRPVGAGSQQAALDAAEAEHIRAVELVKEAEVQANAANRKAQIDCTALAPGAQSDCKKQADTRYRAALDAANKQRIDADERWTERKTIIFAIAAAKRAAAKGQEEPLYRQGIQVGIANCMGKAASPLWSDPGAGVKIGTALAAGNILRLANLAGVAAVPGTLQSLQAVICGPPQASANDDPYERGQEDGEAYCKWAGQVAAGGIARTRAPLLDVDPTGNGGKMLGQAIGLLKAAPPAERVGLFQQFADQIAAATQGGWTATRQDLPNGDTIFFGQRQGEALVFDPAGQMFRGRLIDAGSGPAAPFTFGPGGTLIPNYGALRPVR